MTRRSWIGVHDEVPQKRQCVLASVVRCTVYTQRKLKTPSEGDQVLKRLIDEVDLGFCQYTRHPCYGSSKMVVYLGRCGHRVNRKRAQRLLRSMGLAGLAGMARCCGGAREPGVEHSDITYIRLASGFAYLVAIIDWYSRRVLNWRNSNTMQAVFCLDCLENALREHSKPEVFNSDQGTQFTSEAFRGVLKCEGVTISMHGQG